MTEHGGTATQAGIFYQNTIAARYLADLLALAQSPSRERVSQVRIEAPTSVDDIVVRFADGHHDWVQAKTRIQAAGDAWKSLWTNLAAQALSKEFGPEDRLLLVIGEYDDTSKAIRDLCERAISALDKTEWLGRLGDGHKKILNSIETALGSVTEVLELLRRTTVEIASQEEIERNFERSRVGTAAEARMVELLPLDKSDIVRFADAMKSRMPTLDGWAIAQRLEAYPDLERLARIPLFLSMLIALSGSKSAIPTNRADLIETYTNRSGGLCSGYSDRNDIRLRNGHISRWGIIPLATTSLTRRLGRSCRKLDNHERRF